MNRLDEMTQVMSGFRFGPTKRKHLRVELPGFVGDLADGKMVLGGIVTDISPGGFKITNMTKSFAADKHTYTAILSGGGNHYRLLAKPCWKKRGSGDGNVEIGFKILDAPWQWIELTMNEIPQFDSDDTFGFLA
jgi:hypothetical protein